MPIIFRQCVAWRHLPKNASCQFLPLCGLLGCRGEAVKESNGSCEQQSPGGAQGIGANSMAAAVSEDIGRGVTDVAVDFVCTRPQILTHADIVKHNTAGCVLVCILSKEPEFARGGSK